MDAKKEEELKGLDFSEALKLLAMGHKVRRLIWPDEEAFVRPVKVVGEGGFSGEMLVCHWEGGNFLPWTPDQADLFARDWTIVRV